MSKQETNSAAESREDPLLTFNEAVNAPQKGVGFKWRYGAYLTWSYVKEFFKGPIKPKVEHTTFADTAETLIDILSSEDKNAANIKEVLEESKQLLDQQKTTDDTWARRRLERWATRLIASYLIFVLFLVLLRGFINVLFISFTPFISDQVMIVILSTTTINIIGLGVIVLKGHFYNGKDLPPKKS